ncbi:MAG: N-acetyl-gamma-glutamyl-phosphate reductase [Saprospiraceae bacterium]|nr:N-acetyl-gamma-glutamyl-phosphate reductase [Saprospiraceae bacterium]HRD82187.1 N-acetyl-gamma-glutamyl-phosphate reductase [Saprospiraceae bacterium]
MKTKVGIIGGAGYTGGELIRILLQHPQAEIAFVHSNSQAGKPLHAVHTDLLGDTDLRFSNAIDTAAEVLFLCSGHHEARKFLESNHIPDSTRIIDLSQDFRLEKQARIGSRSFVYGLPELHREAIRQARSIANPGCFATAIQLGLLPLAKAGILGETYSTGITGSTGAGQSLSATTHFSWRANNISAYKTLTHQHLHEIRQSLAQISPGEMPPPAIHFVPWRGDFTRGIYVSSIISTDRPLQEIQALYRNFYADAPFTHVSDAMIDLKQVVNSNKCLIHTELHDGKLVVHSAIDNLLKGASGQAVQNLNLMMGWMETAGLGLKGTGF